MCAMRLFRHYEHLPAEVKGAAVAVGNFDGVHVGHREVIAAAGRIARASNRPWAVLTLEPHPRAVFRPDAAPFRLTPAAVKARLIEALGVDALVIVPFDAAFARLSARSFVETVVVNGLAAHHVVCGHDFAFGHGRRGTPELLLWLGDEFGFGFTCVSEVRDADGEPYSSTRIRSALRDGDLATATHLLGRPFEIEGNVIEGARRGRSIGFPTANLALGEYVCPAAGVYAVRAAFAEDAAPVWLDGVANIGRRPTFDGREVLLEVHLLDAALDLYGRTLRVQLVARLRGERRFDGIDALREQISSDAEAARRMLQPADPRTATARAGDR
jgi:riboflavin kinase/FMN adenylyltransferase